MLRLLMESNGLKPTEAFEGGRDSQSTLSAVLNGNRSLTKQQVVTLAKFFHVSLVAFLPA